MRKFTIILFAILILGMSVIPAYASDFSEHLYYPVLNFDHVFGSGFDRVFAWPFNTAQLGMNNAEFEIYDGLFYGGISTTNVSSSNMLNASFITPVIAGDIGADMCLTLSSFEPQVVPRGYLGSEGSYEIFSNSSDLTISSVRLSGYVGFIDSRSVADSKDQEYFLKHLGFDRTFYCDDDVARIGNWLNECMNSISEIESQYYVLLEQLVVDITVSRVTNSTPQLFLTSHLSPNIFDINQWLYQFDLDKTTTTIVNGTTDFDVTTWLTKSVGSFLDFEIMPGFSLNKLFYVVLVIGVLLWFFHVFS